MEIKTIKRTIKLGFVIGLIVTFFYTATMENGTPTFEHTMLVFISSVLSVLIAYSIVVLIANWKVGDKKLVGFLSEIYKNINNANK